MQKTEHFLSALSQLEKAVELYSAAPGDSLYRDGLIQRFEFTCELAWKSLKEYLEDQGISVPLVSPRSVLKEAFAAGVIHDRDAWDGILLARNRTSHIYSEEMAVEISGSICRDYLPAFRRLAAFYAGSDPA